MANLRDDEKADVTDVFFSEFEAYARRIACKLIFFMVDIKTTDNQRYKIQRYSELVTADDVSCTFFFVFFSSLRTMMCFSKVCCDGQNASLRYILAVDG